MNPTTPRDNGGWLTLLPALTVAVVPAALAAADGGYFASSWGWASLAFGWLAALGLIGGGPRLGPSRVTLTALALLVAWTLLSALWAPSTTTAIAAAERTLPVLLGLFAFQVVVRRRHLEVVLLALVIGAAAICAFALGTRLFPVGLSASDTFSGYRLTRPLGYWNALGIYAVLPLLIVVSLQRRAARWIGPIAAATAPIFAVAAYFTFSRGAIVALVIGLLATFALDPERVRWLMNAALLGVTAAAGVVAASRAPALTNAHHTVGQAAHEGHRLAVVIAILCVASASLALLPARMFALPPIAQRVVTAAVSGAVLLTVVVGLVLVGGPAGVVNKFKADSPVTEGHLNQRLFSVSGSARAPLWAQAWHEFEAHPVLGGGAGSYQTYYLRHRTHGDKVKNAHNQYLETLAELGPLGVALLLVGVVTPVGLALRRRHNPLVAPLAGAFAAFTAHLAVDWAWQLTAVAITGLFCAGGVFVASRSDEDEQRGLSRPVRHFLVGGTLALLATAFVGLVSNMSLAKASTAAGSGQWAASAREASRAHTWAPWSSEAYRLLGEAQLGQGDTKAAIASFRAGIAKSPDDWNLWFDLARATTGHPQRQALGQAARRNPLSSEIAELRREIAAEAVISVVPK